MKPAATDTKSPAARGASSSDLSEIRAAASRARFTETLPADTPVTRLRCASKEAAELRAYAAESGIPPVLAATEAVRFFLTHHGR